MTSYLPANQISFLFKLYLSYIELGTGPGLLIVHGAFRMAKHYVQLAEYLEKIVDRRGRGESEYNGQYTT